MNFVWSEDFYVFLVDIDIFFFLCGFNKMYFS